MKKTISLLMALLVMLSLASCAGKAPGSEWTREGYFADENGNILSVTYMDDVDEPGWYVGCMLGEDYTEDAWGGMLPQEGNTLKGTLPASGSQDDLKVTISEEGTDGLLLKVDGGGTYHFTLMDIPEATIFVTIDTEGYGGMIEYAEGETAPEIDPEWPYQSAQINLEGPETYTFAAQAQAGVRFVKWTKDGEDLSTDPVITVLLDESAEFVAVFEDDPAWQNPVMNFIGEYMCGRARANVSCFEYEEAWITIEWSSSASELARWEIMGRLDTDTMTIEYEDVSKYIVTYDASGEETSQEPEYEDGTGTITFNDDGTFTWHEDQGDHEDMVFEFTAPEG